MGSVEGRGTTRASGWTRRALLKRAGLGIVVGGALAPLAAACSGTTPPAGGTSAPSTAAGAGASSAAPAGKKGGTIVEVAAADLGSGFNPVVNNVTFDSHVQRMMFAALLAFTAKGDVIPDLAADLPKISADGLTYTFTLRDGLKWSDGLPITSDDALFTFQLMSAPEWKDVNSPFRGELTRYLDTLSAPDPKTIVFKFKTPYVAFPTTLGQRPLVPKHVLGKLSADEINKGAFNRGPSVVSGQFKFVEWITGNKITLARNDNYWQGAPLLDGYVYKVAQESLKVQQLQTGEADFGRITTGTTVAAIKAIPTVNIFAYETTSGVSYVHQLDPAKPISKIFQDKQVRKALYTALNREGMNAVYLGAGKVLDSNWPYMSFAHNPNMKTTYKYDPQKAAEMLDGAGWKRGANGVRAKDGQEMRWELLTSASSVEWQNVAQIMQQNWKAIGVEITVKSLEFGQLNQITTSKNFEMSMAGGWIVPGPDPDAVRLWHSKGSANVAPYSNPTLDKLLDDAAQIADQAKRKELYYQAQEILMDDLPTPPMALQPGYFAVNKRIHGIGPEEIGHFTASSPRQFMHKVWVD